MSLINPRVILLDLDGTLADSLFVMRFAYQTFLEQFARKASDAEFASLNGPSLSEIVRRLKASHSLDGDEEALLANYSGLIDQTYASVKPSLGAVELLQQAKKNSCTVGIVTSNSKKRTQAWLETVGLFDMIEFVVSGEDVQHGKPHPEPYLMAIRRSSFLPTEIVAVEDSAQGAKSAVDAGLRTFIISHSADCSRPQESQPMHSLMQIVEHLWHGSDEQSK